MSKRLMPVTFALLALSLALPMARCAAAGGAVASVEIARMTSPEVAAAITAGKTTIIVPTGGIEQNGPHMVLGKHNFIVAETARRVAERLGNALVAPVVAYTPEGDVDKREGHMAYPGTISMPAEVFAAVLEATARSLEAHGFKTIVFLGDSGPNQAPQSYVALKLSQAWAAREVRVISCDNYYRANGGVEWLQSQGESEASIGTHAAIRDTSELMAVFPEGVRSELLGADKDGVVGDARRASGERGKKLLELKVDAAVREIETVLSAPLPDTGGDSLWRRWLRRVFG